MGKFQQARTALTSSIVSILVGILYGWPSYTLELYTNKNTTILFRPMTEIESSLVGSAPALGGMIGCVCVGLIIKRFGCKKTGLIASLPVTISWIIISFTNSPTVIVAARFLAGIACGCFFVQVPILISEVAEDSIRGTLCSVPMAGNSFGLMISYLLGWFLSYKYIIWINITICFTYIILMMTIKESPIHLLRKNRQEDACKSISYYRGVSVSSKAVYEELSRLKQQIKPAMKILPTDESLAEEKEIQEQIVQPYKILFFSPTSRRALILVAILFALQTFMGATAVQVYAKEIFHQSAPNLSPNFCSVIFATVLLVGNTLSATLTDKFGRRMLLMSSSLGTAICLIVLGIQMQTSLAPPWSSAVMIIVYNFIFIVGVGTMPFVLMAEVYIPEVQSLASMIQILGLWLFTFLLLYVFPFMVKYLNIYGSFYVFAMFAVLDLVVAYFWIPETKGLSNEQIQEEFRRFRNK